MDPATRPLPWKTYADRPEVALPALDWGPSEPTLAALGGDPDTRTEGLDLEEIAVLCRNAVGVTKRLDRGGHPMAFRAAACTGALYHIEAYVVVADTAGFRAGVYHYDPRAHRLDRLRVGDHRGTLAPALGAETTPAATIVLTSTWWRNAWKYGERTYRHAFWDSGTVLANLEATATALGLAPSIATGFVDQSLATLLGVSIDREAPVEAVSIGPATEPPGPSDLETIDPAVEEAVPVNEETRTIAAAYRGSAIESGSDVPPWRECDPIVTGQRSRSGSIRLDPVDDARGVKTALGQTIRRRGSCRRFTRDPLNPRKVSTILERAIRGVSMDVRRATGPALQFVTPYVIVHAVDGWPSGVYRYDPDGELLSEVRTTVDRAATGHAMLDQRLGADAAIAVVFVADLHRSIDALGDRGYRVAHLEASIAAGRLYLACAAHRELGSTGLTFYDGVLRDHLDLDGTDRWPVFCWTMGRRP